MNFQMFKLDLEKAKEPDIKIANIYWIIKKARVSGKHLLLIFDYAKAFDSMDHNTVENSSRDENTRPPDLPLGKSVCRSRSDS